MIIFGLILTTFDSSSIFRSSWGSIENWLEPKTKPPPRNLACPNPLNALQIQKKVFYIVENGPFK
jgi:hypothetical protein